MEIVLASLIAILIIISGAFGAGVQVHQATMPSIEIQLPDISIPPSAHSIERHGTETYSPFDICAQLDVDPLYEIWASVELKKVLYLVAMPTPGIWGGRIIGSETQEEITAFARVRKEWNRVIVRDKYQPASPSADIAAITYGLNWWDNQ